MANGKRTRKASKMSFVCQRCGHSWIEVRNSGGVSKWCASCRPEVKREQNRERQGRLRDRRKLEAASQQRSSEFADFRSRMEDRRQHAKVMTA